TIADDFSKLLLGNEQAGPDPTFDLIAFSPAFYVTADGLDDRECRLDDIGTGQGTTKLIRYPQLMDGERFFKTFFQAASGTRIQVHQLVMQPLQRSLRIGIVDPWHRPFAVFF